MPAHLHTRGLAGELASSPLSTTGRLRVGLKLPLADSTYRRRRYRSMSWRCAAQRLRYRAVQLAARDPRPTSTYSPAQSPSSSSSSSTPDDWTTVSTVTMMAAPPQLGGGGGLGRALQTWISEPPPSLLVADHSERLLILRSRAGRSLKRSGCREKKGRPSHSSAAGPPSLFPIGSARLEAASVDDAALFVPACSTMPSGGRCATTSGPAHSLGAAVVARSVSLRRLPGGVADHVEVGGEDGDRVEPLSG